MLLLATAACSPRRAANEKRYPIKGQVLAVDKNERTATIQHGDIPGYMPGMTMPFKIKNDADLEMLKRRAAEEGLPYQTLISSVLHKYVSRSAPSGSKTG